jgi:hypothetical protein
VLPPSATVRRGAGSPVGDPAAGRRGNVSCCVGEADLSRAAEPVSEIPAITRAHSYRGHSSIYIERDFEVSMFSTLPSIIATNTYPRRRDLDESIAKGSSKSYRCYETRRHRFKEVPLKGARDFLGHGTCSKGPGAPNYRLCAH